MSDKVSYVSEFLLHRYNQVAMAGAACAAVFASLPYGWNGFGLIAVLAAGAEIIGALTIPDLPSFRHRVDRRLQRHAREQRRSALLAELRPQRDTAAMASYNGMCARVQALYRTAGDSRSALAREDVENLDNLTVDFLGLCLLNISLKSRKETTTGEAVQKKISVIEAQLARTDVPPDEERQLRRTLGQYNEVMQRARRLAVRRASLEATLLSMPDKMEEVYQLVMSAPYSSDIGAELEQSLSRLRIAEEVAAEFDDPDPFELDRPARAAPADEPSAASRRAAQSLRN